MTFFRKLVFSCLNGNLQPLHGVAFWKNYILYSIEKAKRNSTEKWDTTTKRPMYVARMMEDIADEMSIKVGKVVHVQDIHRIEKPAQGQFDYLNKFALYCYKHEQSFHTHSLINKD